jgi:hypothetical protein
MHRAGTWTGSESLAVRIENFSVGATSEFSIPISSVAYKFLDLMDPMHSSSTRHATSIQGTLTGRGGNLFIIDDPLKPGDAISEVSRERVIEWYRSTLVCTENLNSDVVMVKPAEDRV